MIEERTGFGSLLNRLDLTGYGVELGVASGRFSDHVLNTSRLAILFSVDRWSDHHDEGEFLRARERLSKHRGRSAILRCSFEQAAGLFADEIFDFIYIDGYAHTGQERGETLHQWWPKLRTPGIFAGHDYSPRWPRTMEQVDAFIAKHQLDLNVTREAHPKYPSWWVLKRRLE